MCETAAARHDTPERILLHRLPRNAALRAPSAVVERANIHPDSYRGRALTAKAEADAAEHAHAQQLLTALERRAAPSAGGGPVLVPDRLPTAASGGSGSGADGTGVRYDHDLTAASMAAAHQRAASSPAAPKASALR